MNTKIYKISKVNGLRYRRRFPFKKEIFSVTFCVKPPEEDAYVSTELAMGHGWEPDLVSKVMEAMTLHPEAVLLDLGSNIGAYTLPVASMGRRVVAVDMMRDNLAYIKTSLAHVGLESYVELVNNAVRLKVKAKILNSSK